MNGRTRAARKHGSDLEIEIRSSIYSKRIQYPRPGFGFEAGF
jgi:hypothetical protein